MKCNGSQINIGIRIEGMGWVGWIPFLSKALDVFKLPGELSI